MGKVINSYKGIANPMSSEISIDSSLFLPKVDSFMSRRNSYAKQQREVSRLTIEYAQEWLDSRADDKGGPKPETQRTARLEMSSYVKKRLDLSNVKRSYFVPVFIWQWLASKIIAYIVKLIIEHYWSDLVKEWRIDI